MRGTSICGARRPGTISGPGRGRLPCVLGAPHDGRPHLNAFADAWTGEAATVTPEALSAAPELSPDDYEYQQLSAAWDQARARLSLAPDSARHRATLRRIELLMSILLRGMSA